MEPAILVHGGVGQPSSHSDGTYEAAKAAMEILNGGGDALDAVVKAVMMLEDDERFNAGTGSRLTLDGACEMDAIVMDSRGRLGAVAAITDVKNPVLVARKVMESPHKVLAGKGATKFARRYGFSAYDPITDKNRERLKRYKAKVLDGQVPEWLGNWSSFKDVAHDTVGAVAIDRRNVFAAASSSGGTNIQLQGRVGDVPMVGCSQWVDKNGAVISTGVGEAIMEKILSYRVYQKYEEMNCKEAADWGVSLYPKEVPIGVLTISKDGWGISANTFMACTIITWDTTLNGNEIWPESEDHEDGELGPHIPIEAVQDHHAAHEEGRVEAHRAVQELVAPPPQPMTMPQQPPPTMQPAGPPPQSLPRPPAEPEAAVGNEEIIKDEPVQPEPPPAPAPKPSAPQKFRCPYCTKIFAVEVHVRPVKVFCPH